MITWSKRFLKHWPGVWPYRLYSKAGGTVAFSHYEFTRIWHRLPERRQEQICTVWRELVTHEGVIPQQRAYLLYGQVRRLRRLPYRDFIRFYGRIPCKLRRLLERVISLRLLKYTTDSQLHPSQPSEALATATAIMNNLTQQWRTKIQQAKQVTTPSPS
ncbi:MAG: hypothetical protein WD972_03140 [Candidatus Andersenbacteria bacterium]